MSGRDRKDEEWKTAMQDVRNAKANQKTWDRERKNGFVLDKQSDSEQEDAVVVFVSQNCVSTCFVAQHIKNKYSGTDTK